MLRTVGKILLFVPKMLLIWVVWGLRDASRVYGRQGRISNEMRYPHLMSERLMENERLRNAKRKGKQRDTIDDSGYFRKGEVGINFKNPFSKS